MPYKKRLEVFLALICFVAGLYVSGCPTVERVAYTTAVGAKAFTSSVQSNHPECATATSTLCKNLARAVAAKDTLIDAAEIYCSGPDFLNGGPCQPPSKKTAAYQIARDKLQAAINAYDQTEKDVKGAMGQ